MSTVAAGWFTAGKTRGLALDLDSGTLLVSVDGADWVVAFQTGCAPGPAVGAGLFPAVSGSRGARVRCNWGADAGRPMRHGPPASGGYRAVGLLLDAPQVAPPPPPPPPAPLQPHPTHRPSLHL